MKNIFITLLAILAVWPFTLSLAAETVSSKPKYGPGNMPYATTLAASHDYFTKHPSPDFWALIGYYVPQYSGSACSLASVTMILNAARAHLSKSSDDKLILQQELVEKIKVQNWKERLSTDGYGAKKLHGTSLDVLREITEAAFKANGFPNCRVEAIHVRDLSEATLASVHKLLVENEKSANDFILANFNQKLFTDDAEAGHIAPVGAYDAEKKRVLILDPDREWYEPYWISEKRFLEGMNTKDSESSDYRGFLVIHLNHKQ